MARPAAMFFDIENIVGGYGEGFAKRVAGVSLAAIEGQIADAHGDLTGQFAVKRAYADWSQRDLRTLRKTIVEQGIEPRQVFGFGQGGKTNAADIELVIDVLELLHSRDAVTTYVIVSGDGGFGSLVRKLHEFGKQVIVAGQADRASAALRAVCDRFVVLDPPVSADLATRPAAASNAGPGSGPVDLMRAAVGPPPPVPVRAPDDLLEVATAFVTAVTTDAACLELLDKDGLLLANVGDVLKDFAATDAVKSSFRGLRPFLSQILEGSNWIATMGGPGQPAKIVRRDAAQADESLTDPKGGALSEDERAVIEEATKGDPLALPGAIAAVLTTLQDRADGKSLEIGRLMHEARGTGLREVAQRFFGTTTKLFRVALSGTDLCVMQSIEDPTRNWIRSRIEFDGDAEAMRVLDDLPLPSHAQMARGVLQQAGLRLPADRDDVTDVLSALEQMPLRDGENLNELISRLVGSETLPEAVELAALQQMLALLTKVGVLVGPERRGADWFDEPARQAVDSRAEMLERLRGPLRDALRPFGLDRDDVLDELLPLADPSGEAASATVSS